MVVVHEDKKHLFQDNDYVTFREVEGMTELNGQTHRITVLTPISFRLDVDSSAFSAYTREGVVEQIKVQAHIPFRSLRESFPCPLGPDLPAQEKEMVNPDMYNWDRS